MISESIGILQNLAQDTTASGPLAAAKDTLDQGVLGGLMQAVARVSEMRTAALTAVQGNGSDEAAADGPAQQAASAIEEVIDHVNAAIRAADAALGHEQAFRAALVEIATRHSG